MVHHLLGRTVHFPDTNDGATPAPGAHPRATATHEGGEAIMAGPAYGVDEDAGGIAVELLVRTVPPTTSYEAALSISLVVRSSSSLNAALTSLLSLLASDSASRVPAK